MKRGWVLATAMMFGMAGVGAAAPASAMVPAKKPGGKVVFTLSYGCSAKLVGPGKKKTTYKVPDKGVLKGLPPGTYRVKVKPKTCKSKKSTVKVKQGKKVTVEVLNDPRLVPTSLTGSFEGTETSSTMKVSWSGEITLKLWSVGTASFPLFPQLAQYEVDRVSGSWTISGGVPGGCSYSGSGSLTRNDFGEERPAAWMNPWDNSRYAFEILANTSNQWPYVATCPDVRNESRPIPFRLLATNQWSGIDPVPPLPSGANPSGTYTWSMGPTSTTWTWNLGTDLSKEYSRP